MADLDRIVIFTPVLSYAHSGKVCIDTASILFWKTAPSRLFQFSITLQEDERAVVVLLILGVAVFNALT